MTQETSSNNLSLLVAVGLAVCLMVTVSCEQKSHPLTPVRKDPLVGGSKSKNEESPAESELEDSPVAVAEDSRLPDDVFSALVGSTVRVITNGGDASGVTIGKDAEGRVYLLTAHHATETNIRAIDLFSVTSTESHKRIAPLETIAVSERCDLAVLRSIDAVSEAVEVTPIRRKLTKPPTYAYSCGYTPSKGTIPLPEKIVDTLSHGVRPGQTESSVMWKTKKAQAFGRSGGPLVALDGSLIGLASGKDGANGYYCHHSEIIAQLDENDLGWLVK